METKQVSLKDWVSAINNDDEHITMIDDGTTLKLSRCITTVITVNKTTVNVNYIFETTIENYTMSLSPYKDRPVKFEFNGDMASTFLSAIALFTNLSGKNTCISFKYYDDANISYLANVDIIVEELIITLWNNNSKGEPKIHPYKIYIDNPFSKLNIKMLQL